MEKIFFLILYSSIQTYFLTNLHPDCGLCLWSALHLMYNNASILNTSKLNAVKTELIENYFKIYCTLFLLKIQLIERSNKITALRIIY